jgi:2'-5' RNA ligase
MRLFVALDISDALRQAAAECVERLSRRFAKASPGFKISWVPPERLHLTIQFIGEVPTAVAEEIDRRLSAPFPVPPFDLALDGIGMFPTGGRPRVVWVGIGEGGRELQRVHEETVARLEEVPFRREARAFSPHLTLGRFREPPPAALRRSTEGVRQHTLGQCTIADVTLYQSRLSPKGPTYVALRRVPLRGR